MSMRQVNRRVRKSIAIIGEGLTEYRYVDDMRTTERYRFRLVPGIPKHSDIDDIVNLAKERVYAGYDYVLCLIDMDVIEGNHDKMEHYRSLKKDKFVYFSCSLYLCEIRKSFRDTKLKNSEWFANQVGLVDAVC